MVEGHQRTENKRTKESTAKGQDENVIQKIGGEWKFQKKPQFITDRSKFFDELYAQQTEKYAGKYIFSAQFYFVPGKHYLLNYFFHRLPKTSY